MQQSHVCELEKGKIIEKQNICFEHASIVYTILHSIRMGFAEGTIYAVFIITFWRRETVPIKTCGLSKKKL